MSDELPSATCPDCGQWIPCQHPVWVIDEENRLGRGPQRWISLETPAQALERHRRGG